MRHVRIGVYAALAWTVAIAAGLGANAASALAWLLPIAAGATVALAARPVRTVAMALPIASLASIEPSSTGPRAWLVVVSVATALLAVGALDAWADCRPDRRMARIADRLDLAAWRADRRRPLLWLAAVIVAASIGWVILAVIPWPVSGWVVALLPAVALIAVAVALWPLRRANPL
jgi:hypothetical protein